MISQRNKYCTICTFFHNINTRWHKIHSHDRYNNSEVDDKCHSHAFQSRIGKHFSLWLSQRKRAPMTVSPLVFRFNTPFSFLSDPATVYPMIPHVNAPAIPHKPQWQFTRQAITNYNDLKNVCLQATKYNHSCDYSCLGTRLLQWRTRMKNRCIQLAENTEYVGNFFHCLYIYNRG